MAVYEFACADCGEEFTVELAMSERTGAKIVCPQCAGNRVQQVYRAVQISTGKTPCGQESKPGCCCDCCCGH